MAESTVDRWTIQWAGDDEVKFSRILREKFGYRGINTNVKGLLFKTFQDNIPKSINSEPRRKTG